MATHAQIAARLLRDAAKFFRNVAAQNEALRATLNDNADVYDQVATLVGTAQSATLKILFKTIRWRLRDAYSIELKSVVFTH